MKKLFTSLAIATILLISSNSRAQSPQTPDRIVLHAARMLDVRAGKIVANPVVVIEGEKIAAVGGAEPKDARVIDLGDVTLLPGLIDCHTHLTTDFYEKDSSNQFTRESPADRALRGARNARTTLLAGFTTVRDLGYISPLTAPADVALAQAIDQGWVMGPRVIPVAHPLSITGGHADPSMLARFDPGSLRLGPEEGIANGTDEVVKAVRAQIKYGAKWIKVCATAGVLSLEGSVGAQQYSQAELNAIVEEAARHGVRVAAHAHGTEGILAAVRAGVASIEHGSMLTDEAIALMKQKGTYLVPTDYVTEGINPETVPPIVRKKLESIKDVARQSHRKAIAAGVKIAFGTDAGVFPHGHNAREFARLVELGMTPADAIRTATINAADLLDLKDRASIEPTRLADLIAVRGNPLDDVRVLENPIFVMKGGQVVKGSVPIKQD